jgi:methylated-DNA-[protein]-cysteine S-methyltransferase
MRGGSAARWALFDTALGRCGLAWVARGLTSVRLPARDDGATVRGWPAEQAADSLPEFVAAAIQAIRLHLVGQPRDLREVPLMMDDTGLFERRVYEAARALGPGQTCTYGDLARVIGEPAAMRAVGAALGANPRPIIIPCHRVLAAGGKLGGFSAPGGIETKRALLLLESTMVRRDGELF